MGGHTHHYCRADGGRAISVQHDHNRAADGLAFALATHPALLATINPMSHLPFLPCPQLMEALLPAFAPCSHFGDTCAGIARWAPENGHVPRGFIGGFGSLEEIDLVLIIAEPGDPLKGEHHDVEGNDPGAVINRVVGYVFEQFETQRTQFQRNLRRILDGCWPDMPLRDQLCRTWVTESYLCSAPRESGPVPSASAEACVHDYLAPQIALLADRAVVACGKKAQRRLRLVGGDRLDVGAVAPPAGNLPRVRAEWGAIPGYVAQRRAART